MVPRSRRRTPRARSWGHQPTIPDDFAGVEEPFILESAYRHQVGEADMLHALRFAIDHVRQADNMVMFIGPDVTGSQLVEVGVVIWWSGELAIVHAMKPAREKYLRLKPKK